MNHKNAVHTLEEALALHKSMRHDEAEKLYSRVRLAQPRNFDAWFLSGAMAFQRGGHLEEAVHLLTRARKLNPASLECRLFLGMALADLKRFAEAEPHLSAVLKKIPGQPEAWENLVHCRRANGDAGGAVEAARRLCELQSTSAQAHNLLGETVALASGFGPAEEHFRKAVECDAGDPAAWSNLGLALLERPGAVQEGMDCFDRALGIDPFFQAAAASRALGLLRLYETREALDAHNSLLWMSPGDARTMSARNMILNYLDSPTCEELAGAHREFGELFPPVEERVFFNPREPERPLRVGFVSPDLRTHSVAFFLEPLLRHLDRSRFAVFLYHNHHLEDAVSARLRALSTKWSNISAMDHQAACEAIRKDAPDILIDLAGHSSLNRLPVFAMRPAPILATYLGYPHSTGLREITCRLVDDTTDPPGPADGLASERLVRFSTCAWLYQPPVEAPDPSIQSEGVTFGSFNNFLKASPATLAAWSALLDRIPAARLVLKSPNFDDPEVARRIRSHLESAGLPLARVELCGLQPRLEDHLGQYRRIDVALDTFPYNGTTTTCEALWMGVPVVTVRGDRHAARVGESLLRAVGHPEWCAADVEEYVNVAVRLASDREGLAALRSSLRSEMAASILLDHPAQAARFGDSLRAIWRDWCASP